MRWGRMAVLAATTTAFFAAASPAWATVSLQVTPSFPSSVPVPAAGLAASITVTNNSTPADGTVSATLTSINLVPACGTTTFTGPGDCPAANADPGVFTVSSGLGRVGTACASTTFTISSVDAATGQVSFTPGASVTLTNPASPTLATSTCIIDFTITVNHGPTQNGGNPAAQSVPTFQLGYATTSVGTGSGFGATTVVKAAPPITTTATGSAKVGTPIYDTAALSAAIPPGLTPTGTITFAAYLNDTACTTTPAFTSTVAVSSGTGVVYASAPFTPTAPGTYRWLAFYGGDINNASALSPCGAAGETTSVSGTTVTPTITTAASQATTVGGAIADKATLSGGNAPTGTISFALFGPGNTSCTGTPIFTSTAAVNGNGTYTSQGFTTTAPGTYVFVAVYGGDANNAAASGACGAAGESVVVSSAPPPPPPPPPTITPMLSAVSQSASTWHEGNALAHISGFNPPVGTTFSFTLNESARVTFAFTHKVSGRKISGSRCVAQTNSNLHKPSCRRTVTAGTVSFNAHRGTNKVSFQGRISRTKRLGLGTYTLVITAGNSTRRLTFTIIQ